MKENRSYKAKMSFLELTRNLFMLSLFFIGCLSQAQVSSSIDTTQIRVGEEIIYSIQVEADSTALVLFPEGQSFNPLEVIESYGIDTTRLQDKIRLIKKYGLTQFDSGSYTLPSQRIVINNKPFNTDSVNIEVANVIVDTTKQKMFHIKPAFEVEEPGFDFEKLLYWILPILVIIGLVAFLYFRSRKKKREEAAQQLPPYEEAIEALKVLDHSHYLENDNSKSYYSSLTEILKRYIDREVDDTALESTSNELIERLLLHKDAG
ncbi:MAG: cbb3-type cytochrome oxidase subunit 3, partial [bacterium]